jgi:transcriptional regulator with XRE-family HTH domain
MKERLLEFLKAENKSSAQFAEDIGVQPSGISHILSGRNNPSLDFVLKMLEKYQFLSTDWL